MLAIKFYALTWKKSTMKTTLGVDQVVFHWKCGKRQHQSGSEKETRSKSKCKYLHKDKAQILAQPAWIPCILDICKFQPAESRERFPTLFRNPDYLYLEITILLDFFLSPASSYLPRTRSPHILAGSRSFQHPGDKTSQCLIKILEAIIPCQRSNRGRRKFWARDCPTWRKILTQALLVCPFSPPEGCWKGFSLKARRIFPKWKETAVQPG